MTARRLVLRATESVRAVASPHDAPWLDAITAMQAVVGADAACFLSFDLAAGQLDAFLGRGHDSSAMGAYAAQYHQQDAVARHMLKRPASSWSSSHMLTPETRRASSAFFMDFLGAFRIQESFGVVVERTDGRMVAFGFQCFSKNADVQRISRSLVLRRLAQELTTAYRARQLAAHLAHQQRSSLLDPQHEAACTVSPDGSLAADHVELPPWLAHGEAWQVDSSRLVNRNPRHQQRFLALLRAALAVRESRSTAFRVGWGEVHHVRAIRADDMSTPGGPEKVAVLVSRRDAFRAPSEAELIDAYGVTVAEARLFRLLLLGHELQACATLLQVSINTVRKQLASLMKRTSCYRQSELIRLGSLL